jgi:thioredoxin-dependent peroxiredoxin
LADFDKLGAVVVGISTDDVATLTSFQAKMQAPQQFVSDVGEEVTKSYGADISGVAKRVTFVIGKDGTILYSYYDWSPLTNVNKVYAWLQAHPQN